MGGGGSSRFATATGGVFEQMDFVKQQPHEGQDSGFPAQYDNCSEIITDIDFKISVVSVAVCCLADVLQNMLNFIIEPGQIKPDPARAEAVAECPTPSSRCSSSQAFLILTASLTETIVKVAAPLIKLTFLSPHFMGHHYARRPFICF